eukprot:TRINITY_DN76342_c0_g1_i1.p1 TRINITY_DN76342_c0_g1~~TRINITY_DN76342_c0_g1_i1.p1  ORF type:complete len:636 (-),score=106.32 TRINITY_DN76342_c0_g1_i1:182-2089(-)
MHRLLAARRALRRGSSLASAHANGPSPEVMKHSIQQILAALPSEWRGTTFNNSKLLGREGFAQSMEELIARKSESGERISKEELAGIGNAEDYLRVATNIATTLETVLARERGMHVSQVFTFASATLPIFAVGLVSKLPVNLYLGNAKSPFTKEQRELLEMLGVKLSIFPSYRIQAPRPDEVVLAVESATLKVSKVDGIIAPNVLYIVNSEKIPPPDILVVRKRMSTPVTTPVAESMLQMLAGMPVTANIYGPAARLTAKFYDHLQTLCGTPVDTSSKPVVTTVGLSALCSLWVTLIARGGADVLMCSTAYGGTVQMTDIFDKTETKFRKHDFHIQGADAKIGDSIQRELKRLAGREDLLPLTVVFLEIPTNPDMKVPDLPFLVSLCEEHKRATGKQVMLLVDSTFAPGSKIMRQLRDLSEELCVMVFISLSKSVSRGLTTAGTVIANHTQAAKDILHGIGDTCKMLDTEAKPDQLMRLVEHHARVEDRCRHAYRVAETVGEHLRLAVREFTGHDMPLAFVTPEQAAAGFTTSSFSFNLPAPPGASAEEVEGVAQRFVDLLCEHSEFKPCVSFGQDNGLVYATVPATSTQGAVKEEDKAAQAVGGVQLVRLSFPPTCDMEAISNIIAQSVAALYR